MNRSREGRSKPDESRSGTRPPVLQQSELGDDPNAVTARAQRGGLS